MFLHNKDLKGKTTITLQMNNILFEVTSAGKGLSRK